MIVALLGVTLADNTPGYGAPAQTYQQPQQQQHQQQHHQPSHNTPPKYNFNYDVHGYGDYEPQFNAQEARDGYATQGSYSAKLPDGRTQTVTYRVDDAYSGFVADVKYEGEAKYPSYQSQLSLTSPSSSLTSLSRPTSPSSSLTSLSRSTSPSSSLTSLSSPTSPSSSLTSPSSSSLTSLGSSPTRSSSPTSLSRATVPKDSLFSRSRCNLHDFHLRHAIC